MYLIKKYYPLEVVLESLLGGFHLGKTRAIILYQLAVANGSSMEENVVSIGQIQVARGLLGELRVLVQKIQR
jgi:hypothetical protein